MSYIWDNNTIMLCLSYLIGGGRFEAVGADKFELGDPLGGGFAGVGDDVSDLAVGEVVACGEFLGGDGAVRGVFGGGGGPGLEDFTVAWGEGGEGL